MKFQADRKFYIPAGATVVTSKTSSAVVYLAAGSRGQPVALGFVGKAQKPAFHYSFKTEARRAEYCAEWFRGQDAASRSKQQRKAQRNAFVHTLKVGDVLRSSWGYDQTNVDFYEVTKVVGKSVEIREIAQESMSTGDMMGKCIPVPGKYTGEPKRKLVQEGNCVKVRSWGAYARPAETIEVAGAKVYAPASWTAYA